MVFSPGSASAQPSGPNIVLIVLDDLGYGDFGVYGGGFIATPRIDGLASQGMRFPQFYVNAPTCSSSRVAFLTGQYPVRLGFRKALRWGSTRGLPSDVETLADRLTQAGYVTGQFGKWHVGSTDDDFLPHSRGFQRSAIKKGGGPGSYQDQVFVVDGDHFETPSGHLTNVTTDYALDFIAQNQSNRFFAQIWYNAPHNPLAPLPEWASQYPDTNVGRYAAMVAHADAEIGRVLDALTAASLDDNTLVLVASDNGAWASSISPNGPLRGQKDELWEGGIRVPLVVRWPGNVPAASVNDSVTSGLDLIPTLAAFAGANLSGLEVDGRELSASWLSNETVALSEPLFWEDKPSTSFVVPPSGEPYAFAVRLGRWKLVHVGQSGPPYLYDLAVDPAETNDLASQNPGVAADLDERYRAWRRGVGRIDHRIASVDGAASHKRGVMSFDGGSIRLKQDLRFDFAEADFSLQARIRLDQLAASPGGQVIAERPQSWRLWVDGSGFVHLEVEGQEAGQRTLLQSTQPITAGVDHQVTFTAYGWINSPSTVRLYLDGVLQQESNEIPSALSVDGAVVLGNSATGDLPLFGEISFVDFFRMSMSAAEVLDRDLDGLANPADNCLRVPNAAQVDADGDAVGNACDGDFDQDTWVTSIDREVLDQCLGRTVGAAGGPSDDPTCTESDMNSDGAVDAEDESLFLEAFDPRPKPGCGLGGSMTVALSLLFLARAGRSNQRARISS